MKRLVLLQARRTVDRMLDHEHRCFAKELGLSKDDLEAINLLERPLAEVAELLKDPGLCLFIGGSGDYSVSQPQPQPLVRFILELIPEIYERGIPLFGACWGFHALTKGLGGEVERPGDSEVGTYPMRKVADAQDPLLSQLPNHFEVQMGHKDWVTRLPEGATALFESDSSPLQGARFGEAPIYGFQFHPELDMEANHYRYMAYLEGYEKAGILIESRRFVPSPDASRLLRSFFSLYCAPETP